VAPVEGLGSLKLRLSLLSYEHIVPNSSEMECLGYKSDLSCCGSVVCQSGSVTTGSVILYMQSSVSLLSGVLFYRPQHPCSSLPDRYTAPLSNCRPSTVILRRYATSWSPKLDLSEHQSSSCFNLVGGGVVCNIGFSVSWFI
jgi:hypothetical protein